MKKQRMRKRESEEEKKLFLSLFDFREEKKLALSRSLVPSLSSTPVPLEHHAHHAAL